MNTTTTTSTSTTNTLFSPTDIENLVRAFEDPERSRPEFDRFLFDLEDGEVLEVDFAEIESADEIRNDPRKVLPAPDGGEEIELMTWCGRKMAFAIYNWRPLYLQSVLSCVEDLERDGWEIAWLGWPEDSTPPVGRRFREVQDEHFAKPEVKAEIRKAIDERDTQKALRGDFSFLERLSRKDRLVTNEDRTIPPMDDSGYPPADPVLVAKNTLRLFRGGVMVVGDELAVVQRKTETFAITSPEQLFAFLYQWATVDWNAGRAYLGKKEYLELLRQIAPAYHQISRLPHWPKLDGHLYLCEFPQGVGGEAVDGLLDFFCFATLADRHLYHALLATLISGIPPGTRPAWVISSQAGRGVGKTTCAATASDLFGGSIDVSLNEDMAVIKQRLLITFMMRWGFFNKERK